MMAINIRKKNRKSEILGKVEFRGGKFELIYSEIYFEISCMHPIVRKEKAWKEKIMFGTKPYVWWAEMINRFGTAKTQEEKDEAYMMMDNMIIIRFQMMMSCFDFKSSFLTDMVEYFNTKAEATPELQEEDSQEVYEEFKANELRKEAIKEADKTLEKIGKDDKDE